MALSIVIPAYGRENELRMVLKALESQGKYWDEVIVVNDGGPDRESMELLMSSFPWVKYVYMEPETTEWRLGMARNCGASLSEGDRILFLDSDCVPRPGCCMVHHQYGSKDLVVAGRIDMADAVHCSIRKDRRFLIGSYGNVAASLKKRLTNFETFSFASIWGGHMSVPAEKFKELGGFWEEIRDYGSEDQELAWRMRESGSKLRIDFRANVYHMGPQHPQQKADRRTSVIELSMASDSMIRKGYFLPPEPKEPVVIPSRRFNLSYE
jgi:GT2 family glycosyltransferase